MKVFSVKFCGVHPVGAVAIVVAPNKTSKKQVAEMLVVNQNLSQEIPVEDVKEIDISTPGVSILLDGDY